MNSNDPWNDPMLGPDTDEFNLFAEALASAKQLDSMVNLPSEFNKIASLRAVQLISSSDEENEQYHNSELEARLWDLVNILYGFRLEQTNQDASSVPVVYDYSPNCLAVEKHARIHPNVKENWLILSWIRNAFRIPQEPTELRGIKWLYTSRKIGQKPSGGANGLSSTPNAFANPLFQFSNAPDFSQLVSFVDLDAPLREGKTIDSQDEQYDKIVFKYVFELLRAGQINHAITFCQHTGNFTLKMALAGLLDSPEIKQTSDFSNGDSVKNRGLLRRMCLTLAQNRSLDVYERGIYGLVSSDLQSVLELCDTWESQLMAYMIHIVAKETEQALIQEQRFDNSLKDIPISEGPILSVHQVLEILSHSDNANDSISQQSRHPIRILFGAIINNTVEAMVQDTAEQLHMVMTGKIQSSLVTDVPYIMRIMTHLALILQNLGFIQESNKYVSDLIEGYVQLLDIEDKKIHIPLYVSFVTDNDDAINIYSFILANISDPKERQDHLSLATKYHIDIEGCIREAVKRVFDERPQDYIPLNEIEHHSLQSFFSKPSDQDIRVYRAAEWFVEAEMYEDAVLSTNDLFYRFLSCGKVYSALEFGLRVDVNPLNQLQSSFSSLTSSDLYLLKSFKDFVLCFNKLELWRNHYKERGDGDKNHEVPIKWRLRAEEIIDDIYSTVLNLSSEWMMEMPIDSKFWRLRIDYIPLLVLQFLMILKDAQAVSENITRYASEMANFVASDDDKLYELFVEGQSIDILMALLSELFSKGASAL